MTWVCHQLKIEEHETQEDCNARQELKSKHDKKFKDKEVKTKTKESIKTATLTMENEKIEEQEKQENEFVFGEVVKKSSTQTCNTSEISNNEQNLQAAHDQLVADMIKVKEWIDWKVYGEV